MRKVDVLMEAADRLNNTGWIRGVYADTLGRCCLAGAINRSETKLKYGTDFSATNALAIVLGTTDVSTWNDTKCRSKAHAIKMLYQAASLVMSNKVIDQLNCYKKMPL